MDNFFHRQETGTQQPIDLLSSLQIFKSILNWMAGLINLTEEEQKDAGI